MNVIMDRPSSPKFRKLMQTARDLFFRHGIKRVTIDEICQKAGVSRMMFYRYFRNKDAIAMYILDQIYSDAWSKFDEILAGDIPFEEKIRRIAVVKMEMADEYSMEFLNEFLADEDSECGKLLIRKRKESYEFTRKIYTDAQERGDIRKDIKIDFIMFMMEYSLEIVRDERIQGMYPDISQLIHEMFALLFYGMLSR
jgi:AcrR family transcriptional regulator